MKLGTQHGSTDEILRTIAALGVTAPMVKSDVCTKPLPVSSTICGLPGALSVMVKAPTLEFVDVGLNVTLMVQFVPGCSGTVTQLSVSAKSPLAVMLENVIAVVPSFVAVMLCAGDVEPIATLPWARPMPICPVWRRQVVKSSSGTA